jgi:hypothetical protein
MSGVRAAHSLSKEPPPPLPKPAPADGAVQAMQDILYDILANGMDPESSDVPTQEVERFLFEHARTPKTREQFLAFFAAHGLSVRARMPPEPAALKLPPIQRPASGDDGGMPARVPVELAFGGPLGAPASKRDDIDDESGRARRRPGLAWTAAVGCVLALLGAAGYYGYATIIELQGEIERTARHGRDNQQALKAISDHAAGLESRVAATGELVQRMDQKSDLLIDSLLDEKNKSRKRK